MISNFKCFIISFSYVPLPDKLFSLSNSLCRPVVLWPYQVLQILPDFHYPSAPSCPHYPPYPITIVTISFLIFSSLSPYGLLKHSLVKSNVLPTPGHILSWFFFFPDTFWYHPLVPPLLPILLMMGWSFKVHSALGIYKCFFCWSHSVLALSTIYILIYTSVCDLSPDLHIWWPTQHLYLDIVLVF